MACHYPPPFGTVPLIIDRVYIQDRFGKWPASIEAVIKGQLTVIDWDTGMARLDKDYYILISELSHWHLYPE